MRIQIAVVMCGALMIAPLWAIHLTPEATRAFDAYAASVESRQPAQEPGIPEGPMRVEGVNGGSFQVNGGLLHDWRGVAFISGARRENMLAILRDYDHLASYYAPEVQSSRALATHDGVTTLAIRLKKQKVVTVVLDAEYQVESGLTGDRGGFSVSRSRHIWQINQPGTLRESRLPEGDDEGFLWRLNAYWTFLERPGGLLIECEAISLTRDIPPGLGWLIQPIVRELPRASLESTLTATVNALRQKTAKENVR